MAYIKDQAEKNIDFLTDELGLVKVSGVLLFLNDNFLVLSPAVQGKNKETGAFDVHINSIAKIRERLVTDASKVKLIIVRYYNVFLVGDLEDFIDSLTDEENIYSIPSRPSIKKWQYNIKKINGDYFVRDKGDKSIKLNEYLSRGELLTYLSELQLNNSDEKNEFRNKTFSQTEILDYIFKYITGKGFFYSKENINNLFLSLRTKPFAIISGISGTGKTKIVQLFAEAIGATEKNGQFKLIPVRPDWSDSSDLLGYRDIKGDFVTGPLTDMVEHALEHPELPHFVLLDEMNLARVEYYFSDVLSVMESRKKDEEGNFISSPLLSQYNEDLTLPSNMYIIGTVNMDETTHPFSKKVLDRANTIEFNEINLMNFESMMENEPIEPLKVSNDVLESTYIYLKDAFKTHETLIRNVSEIINTINKHLESIYAQVGYRVRDEISFYMAHNTEAGMLLTETEAMDFCIMQKILPRISGTESIVRPVLKALEEELKQYPRCSAKITEMQKRLDDNGFVSFWTA